jgi:hypothetical protein
MDCRRCGSAENKSLTSAVTLVSTCSLSHVQIFFFLIAYAEECRMNVLHLTFLK